jgi:hypothetical protein
MKHKVRNMSNPRHYTFNIMVKTILIKKTVNMQHRHGEVAAVQPIMIFFSIFI